ncbi:HD-GYP domain-containing protein [Marinospirillum alkaliphilum]|uniref:Putative two-component system response regulator n=1 Tax=Marinospirillum alkaliphilum DSM 21637 TaxID=1122209 RepID=A0A1K1X0G1_9GAMM|nr:HD domain-containing phosphohydrolase [Marinospirillum alkaliphilum]SFX43168.1 putative two-component system response regulator [Marinospirillum alkaliphilum DSM 21637]
MGTLAAERHQSNILIVDDEPANLRLLDKMLGGQGYVNRILVQDPREVLSKFEQQRIDLVLLDINMPHLDGYQVMEQLMALELPLLPPIVILTAQNSKDYLLRALAGGARDFISKPFDRNELLMRVRNLLDAHLAHRMVQDQKAVLEEMVALRTRELHHTRLQVVQRLGRAAEYRDEETGSHILRMSYICALLARSIGWSDDKCDLILNASPMHDVGKIAIPDAILKKPGRFEPHEWEIMKTHAHIGAEMLGGDDSELMVMARQIAISHHEKWDGTGYPLGLAGEAIPLAARIAALADVFDALTSVRPYKKAWTVEAAVDLIRQNSGKHFDPALVEVFLQQLPKILVIRDTYQD